MEEKRFMKYYKINTLDKAFTDFKKEGESGLPDWSKYPKTGKSKKVSFVKKIENDKVYTNKENNQFRYVYGSKIIDAKKHISFYNCDKSPITSEFSIYVPIEEGLMPLAEFKAWAYKIVNDFKSTGITNECRTKIEQKLLGSLQKDSDHFIQIKKDNTVNLMRNTFSIKWEPFPIIMPKQEIVRTVSIDLLYNFLLGDSKYKAFEEVKTKLLNNMSLDFHSVDSKLEKNFIKDVSEKIGAVHQEKIKKIYEKQVVFVEGENIEKLVAKITSRTLKVFKKKLLDEGKSGFNEATNKFRKMLNDEVKKRVLSQSIFDEKGKVSGSMDIIPNNTKFFYQRGDHTIVVVEQKPTTRSIYVRRDGYTGDTPEKFFKLAFPYVILVLYFTKEQLGSSYVFYRTKPLTTLDDDLFFANLSNTNQGQRFPTDVGTKGMICSGFKGHKVNGLHERVDEVVAFFWQSKFNKDYSSTYTHYAGKNSSIAGYENWEKSSRKDQLFMLNINWNKACSFREKIEYLIGRTNTVVPEKLKQEMEKCFLAPDDSLNAALIKGFNSVEVGVEMGKAAEAAVRSCQKSLIEEYFKAGIEVVTEVIGAELSNHKDIVAAISKEVIVESMKRFFKEDIHEKILMKRYRDAETIMRMINEA